MSFDADWFGDCVNTFHEEQKQLVYAPRMGLVPDWQCGHPPTFDLGDRSVIDIGGGPVSLLLKCVNFSRGLVVDPCPYPNWVHYRYLAHGVELWTHEAEGLKNRLDFDEAWIYNVLQHVRDPKLVIERARASARTIRLFEWIEIDPYEGHPHRLEAALLDEWLGGSGFVAQVNESGAVGRAYYGVFST